MVSNATIIGHFLHNLNMLCMVSNATIIGHVLYIFFTFCGIKRNRYWSFFYNDLYILLYARNPDM